MTKVRRELRGPTVLPEVGPSKESKIFYFRLDGVEVTTNSVNPGINKLLYLLDPSYYILRK